MKKIIEFYKSEKKFLFFAYLFLFLGVYNVFRGNKGNYELMFIVSGTQFLLYYIRIWIKNKKVKDNVA
tara:strand:- start:123 stop:326 length:204 start_codon:yes stop_codon:yes gene_type:complete